MNNFCYVYTHFQSLKNFLSLLANTHMKHKIAKKKKNIEAIKMDFLRKVCSTYFIISEICCATCHILPWNNTTFLKQKFKWLKKSHIEFNQVTKQQQQQLAPTKVAPKQVLIYFDIAKHPPPDTQLITKPTPTSPNTTTYVYIILIHSVVPLQLSLSTAGI